MPTLPPLESLGPRYDGWPLGGYYTLRCTWCRARLTMAITPGNLDTLRRWAHEHLSLCEVKEPPKNPLLPSIRPC